jgi:hypothetical protein
MVDSGRRRSGVLYGSRGNASPWIWEIRDRISPAL